MHTVNGLIQFYGFFTIIGGFDYDCVGFLGFSTFLRVSRDFICEKLIVIKTNYSTLYISENNEILRKV